MSAKVFSEPAWAIVELFGRQVIAGQIEEVTIAGGDMLRVDVPAANGMDAYTKFFGNGAIYAITPTTEAGGRHAVEHLQVRPFDEWTIPTRQLSAPTDNDRNDPPGFYEDEEISF